MIHQTITSIGICILHLPSNLFNCCPNQLFESVFVADCYRCYFSNLVTNLKNDYNKYVNIESPNFTNIIHYHFGAKTMNFSQVKRNSKDKEIIATEVTKNRHYLKNGNSNAPRNYTWYQWEVRIIFLITTDQTFIDVIMSQ